MKKREKKLAFSKETVRDLTTPGLSREILQGVGGAAVVTCIPGGTTHCSNLC
jgi:hypothetical protein